MNIYAFFIENIIPSVNATDFLRLVAYLYYDVYVNVKFLFFQCTNYFLFFFSHHFKLIYFFFSPVCCLIFLLLTLILRRFNVVISCHLDFHFVCNALNLFFFYFFVVANFFVTNFTTLYVETYFFDYFKLTFFMDGVSLLLVGLTMLIFLLLTIFYMSTRQFFFYPVYRNNSLFFEDEYRIFYVLIELFLLIAFTTANVLIFYLAFEGTIFPMLFVIGLWGVGFKKIRANYYFLMYTVAGSLFMLIAIISMILYTEDFFFTFFDYSNFQAMPSHRQRLLWLCLFIGFAVKIPVYPFHLWLPEAHVEAPTEGSVILAAILLKLGYYGLLKIANPFFFSAVNYFGPFIIVLCLLGFTFASLTALRQLDMKRIIAYSSVAHMNFATVGLFLPFKLHSILGGVTMMYAHGFVSSALFFISGFLYNRYGTRLINYYGGLSLRMPLCYFFFFVFTLLNCGFPLSLNFYSEFFIFLGLMENYFFLPVFFSIGFVLTIVYSFRLLSYVMHGVLNTNTLTVFRDLTISETIILLILVLISAVAAICPTTFFFNVLECSILFSGVFEY